MHLEQSWLTPAVINEMSDTCFENFHFSWSPTFLWSHFQLESQPGIVVTGSYNLPLPVCLTLHQMLPQAFSYLRHTQLSGSGTILQIKKRTPSEEKGWSLIWSSGSSALASPHPSAYHGRGNSKISEAAALAL